jgi:RNA polymerase sigma-70 factor, ECF subfamily
MGNARVERGRAREIHVSGACTTAFQVPGDPFPRLGREVGILGGEFHQLLSRGVGGEEGRTAGFDGGAHLLHGREHLAALGAGGDVAPRRNRGRIIETGREQIRQEPSGVLVIHGRLVLLRFTASPANSSVAEMAKAFPTRLILDILEAGPYRCGGFRVGNPPMPGHEVPGPGARLVHLAPALAFGPAWIHMTADEPNSALLRDRELLCRFLAGQSDAHETIARWAREIVGFRPYGIPTYEHDDIVQQAMGSLWTACSRPDFELRSGLRALVRKIVLARCVDVLRRQRPTVELGDQLPDDALDAETVALREERLARVARAIQQLDESSRELIRLHFILEIPYAELARRMGLAQPSVRGRMFQCMKDLRALLARDEHDATSRER